jgi:hypothetical protein
MPRLRDGFARRLDWDDGLVKEATLKHFVERLRPVLDDGRYAGAIDMKSLAWQSAVLSILKRQSPPT